MNEEASLQESLRQTDLYTLALEHSNKLRAALQQGQDGSDHLQDLLAAFNEIRALEAEQGQGPSAALREQLHKQLQLAEEEAAACRDRIAPALDQLLRVRRMQRAYNQRS